MASPGSGAALEAAAPAAAGAGGALAAAPPPPTRTVTGPLAIKRHDGAADSRYIAILNTGACILV
jgi:hypothetical protein